MQCIVANLEQSIKSHHDNTLNDAIVSAASNETKQNYVSSYSCSSKATRASNCEEEVVESEVLTSSFYCAVEAFSWADFALEIDEKCYVGTIEKSAT